MNEHCSVTGRIKTIKQPYGGYLSPKEFSEIKLNDDKMLFGEENIHASVIGLVVDYMTRFLMGTPKEEAFKISLQGVICADRLFNLDVKKEALQYFYEIKENDSNSIINACKLVTFDVWYRNPIVALKSKTAKETNPNEQTIQNISIMIQRSLDFFDNYGSIICDGFTFEGGYTPTVSTGDGDFLTEDTLWDFKVSKSKPTNKHTLQLLMYWIMGMHSINPEFKKIKKIGFFNPRLNIILTYDLSKLSNSII
ncbi:MAG: hypothetical protein K2H66_00055, partial [Oscillospiraceae bacterium]|nr:hypothetical protein [Oscillospiraceae bacterium]